MNEILRQQIKNIVKRKYYNLKEKMIAPSSISSQLKNIFEEVGCRERRQKFRGLDDYCRFETVF